MERSLYQSVIFDLDGTLIDSAPGILESFRIVLGEAGLAPAVPIDNALIGPPLRQTLMNLTALPAGDDLEKLVGRFQEIYDAEGYKATSVYTGVKELLSGLASRKVPMAIATNKRRTPTLKILQHFGWDRYFQVVGTLDNPLSPQPDKAALIGALLAEMGADADASTYLGDKREDGEAAAANGMTFFAAGWGYGEWNPSGLPKKWRFFDTPAEIMTVLFHE